jgi:hypothetical protein
MISMSAIARAEAHPIRAPLWRRWVLFVSLGELLAFTIPSFVGGVAWQLEAAPVTLYVALVAAGAGEGAVLGTAQWLALRHELPRVRARAWIGATSLAAAFAWSLGLLPSTLGEHLEIVPLVLLVPALAVGGLTMLFSIGVAQALVVRRQVARAWRWAVANALAWCLALICAIVFMSVLLTEETSPAAGVVIGVVAGALMGVIVAALTGWALVRIASTS